MSNEDLQYVMNALSKAQSPMMDGSHQPDYRECARAIRREVKAKADLTAKVAELEAADTSPKYRAALEEDRDKYQHQAAHQKRVIEDIITVSDSYSGCSVDTLDTIERILVNYKEAEAEKGQ